MSFAGRLRRRSLLPLLMACTGWMSSALAADPTDLLARVQQRGTLVVGVKTDYPPFGMLDAQGQPVGLEHDLAADVAKRLGVALQKVSVTGANRLQKLEEGTIDVVIATMGDTAERRAIATAVEPNYYASGVTLFMRPEARITDWAAIRGQKVCATQGSYFNRPMAQRYLLDLVTFNNARDARLAVRDGRCIGYMFDNTAIRGDLARPEWAGYQAPLPPTLSVPWAIALSRRDRGSAMERQLGDIVADWHRSGFLIEREKAWGLPPSQFLAEAHALWLRKDASGRLLCGRDAAGAWPAECRNPVFVSSSDVGGLRRLGLWVKENFGVDLTLLYDDFDRSRFLAGLAYTVLLMVLCVAGSLGLGLLGALLAESRWAAIRALSRALATYWRMTPPLLQMYLWFFGIGAVLWAHTGLSLSPTLVAVGCLSTYTGAAVTAALLESAAHLRESNPAYRLRWRTLQATVASSSVPVRSALTNVAKATMMASAISVPELLSASTAIMADSGNVAVMMNALLLTFLLLVAVSDRLLARFAVWLRTLA
jgi:polar amino acid transport system substrate-binding protein